MAELSITRSYADDAVLSASMLDDQNDSIETFLNITGITDDNIQDSGITASTKLVNASITAAKIANGTIGSTQIAAGGILNANIADATIAATKLVANSLSDTQIAVGGIGTASVAATAITLAKLATTVQAALNPAGSILAYGGTSAPTGYLLCDGTSYLQSDYAALFTAIGTAYGTANGTHFNVPDFRGRFLRGVDGGASRDPDKASRTAMNTGGATGDNVGSIQADQYKSHTHTVHVAQGGSDGNVAVKGSLDTGTHGDVSGAATASGGNETRPLNASVNFIIKT